MGMKRCSFRPVTTVLVCQGYKDGLMKRSKCRCEGLEVQGTLTKIMLVCSELAFGILLMDPEVVFLIHISFYLPHSHALSHFST